ncbi:MAG: ABC transporter ATP-binding protein/permease [Alphaproteobacteria bacterium]|nr:ABC transporter ATP-binding protein/permease [Alphaproteobacteria bacterium]
MKNPYLNNNTLTSLARRLWQDHMSHYKGYFSLALVCMFFAAISTAALPYLLQPVCDEVFTNGTMQTLTFFCGAVLVAFVVKGFASFGESVLMNYIGQKIISDLQNRLFRHLLKSDLRFFHDHGTGQLISHFTNDVNLMRNAVAHTIIGLGKDSLTLIFLIALMFYRDLYLSLGTFIIFPVIFYPIIRLGKRLRKVSHSTQDYLGELTGFLGQIFQGIRAVKAYSAEDYEIARAENRVKRIFHYLHKASIARSLSHPIVESVGGLAIMGVIGYGGYQIMQGASTTGEFASFITALILSYEPMKRLSNINANIQEGLAAAKRLYIIFDTAPTIEETSKASLPQKPQGTIEFKNVTFAYDNNHPVLNNISFTIASGKNVAFVGPSGAGKSTLINLLPRFYDVSQGEILVDGIDVRHFKFKDLRDAMALVSQEIVLFNESAAANIAYPNQDIDMERVTKASKDAACHAFIEKFPLRYDELLGENGNRISGGQRQRFAIARALYKDAPILLLDEATSALDSESEKQIQKTLKSVMKGRTTLMVAHRLSTIMDADMIYVLNHGCIVEEGTHDELLTQKGLYHQLWTMQTEDGR